MNQKSGFLVLGKIKVVSLFPFLPETGEVSGLGGEIIALYPAPLFECQPQRSEYFWNFDMELIYGRVQMTMHTCCLNFF